MIRNPQVKTYLVLGLTAGVWNAALASVNAFLAGNDDRQYVDETELRDLDPIFDDDRNWNAARDELGL